MSTVEDLLSRLSAFPLLQNAVALIIMVAAIIWVALLCFGISYFLRLLLAVI